MSLSESNIHCEASQISAKYNLYLRLCITTCLKQKSNFQIDCPRFNLIKVTKYWQIIKIIKR